jgi:class 3 adenylate cyclase
VTADAFEETGDIQIGERTLPASRSYRLDRRTDAVAVLRADGSAFISLDGRASQSVRHDCGADLYLGRLLFRGPDEWAEAWRVKGPRKNYASLGWFLRPASPAVSGAKR